MRTTRTISTRLSNLLLARPKTVFAILLLILGSSFAILPGLELASGLDPFLPKNSDLKQINDEIAEHFVNDKLVFAIYRCDQVFSHRNLRVVRELEQQLEQLKLSNKTEDLFAVEKVTSLTNIKNLIGSNQSFQTLDLVPDPIPTDKTALQVIKRQAENNPIIHDTLLDNSGTIASLVIRLPDEFSAVETAEAISLIRALLADVQRSHPRFEFFLTGEPIVSADVASYQAADLAWFMPLGYLIMIIVLFVFLKKVRGVLFSLVIVSFCVSVSMALLAAIGSNLNNCSSMLPLMMMSMSVAVVLHFLSEHGKNSLQNSSKNPTRQTIRELLAPAGMAALTTGIGFGALAISPLPAVHDFGIAAGLGVILTFVITTLIMSLLLPKVSAQSLISPSGVTLAPVLDRLSRLVVERRGILLSFSLVLIVFLGFGALRITVDMNQMEMFHPEAPVRQAGAILDQHLRGSEIYNLSIKTKTEDHFTDPAELKKVEQLNHFLRHELGLHSVLSINDFIKLMHREYAGGDPANWRIPESQEQIAQLLLLAGDPMLDEYIDETRQWIRIVARHSDHSSAAIKQNFERIEAYLAKHFPAAQGYQTTGAGMSKMASILSTGLIHSQVYSLLISFVLIFGLILLLFRSLKDGLLSMPPNLFPIFTNLGLMGWLGIRLDAATVMISTVALGIAVDDTIHFMQYFRTRLSRHQNAERAIRETMRHKGPAIIATSLVISLGFVVSVVSNFQPTRHFGLLICTAMLAALFGDLIVLPALLAGKNKKTAEVLPENSVQNRKAA